MKNIFTILICFIVLSLIGQTEGKVTYLETVQFEIDIPAGMEDVMKDIPKSQQSTKSLLFKNGISLFSSEAKEDVIVDQKTESHDGENVFKMDIRRPEHHVYSDLNKGKVVEMRELLGKPFLIEDDLKKFNWKVTSERRQILDHICMKATADVDDETSVTAWFATDIPVSVGPGDYNGLPGLILMLDVNDGKRVTVAKEVNLSSVDEGLIVPPSKGKNVNRAEYEKIEAKKMKEMNAQSGGNGVRMIVRTRN
jgi:GLPGLI family protein